MKLQIERQVVTAKSRKLSARWTYIDTEPDPDTINDMRQEVLDVHGDTPEGTLCITHKDKPI